MQGPIYKRSWFRIGAAIAGAILIAVIVIIATMDLRSLIAGRISAALDKPVTIADARLQFSLRPRIGIDNLKIGEVDAKGRPDFAHAQAMRVSIDLWQWLTGDLVLPEVSIADAHLTLIRDADGTVNWEPGVTRKNIDAPELPEIESLNIKDTVVVIRDAMTDTNLTLKVATDEAAGREAVLRVTGQGTYQGRPAKVDLRGGSILALRDKATPYPINGTFTAGDTEVAVRGAVTDPTHLTGLDVRLHVKGRDAAELFPLFGIAIFPTPPYEIDTKLDRDGDKWMLTDMDGAVGESDIKGALTWDVSNDQPRLTGDLHSFSLKLRDLAGFIGAAPGNAATPDQLRIEAAEREKARRVEMGQGDVMVANKLLIPDRPMSLEKLNSMSAKVSYKAEEVVTKGFPIDKLSAEFVLNDGVLKLKPLNFSVENGRLSFDITVNSHAKPITTDVRIDVEKFPLHRLLGKIDKSLETSGTSWGAIGGKIELHGTGNSMHQIFATSDGNVALLAEDGQISLLLIELMDLDIAEALGVILTKDRPVDVRCMAADFEVKDGLMASRALVIDTVDTAIIGHGTADLGREVFDIKLDAKPKDNSPAALRVPILIKGSFSDPAIGPDAGKLTARVGAAVALGVVLTPLGALLPLIEIGSGKDQNCAALIRQTEQSAETPVKR